MPYVKGKNGRFAWKSFVFNKSGERSRLNFWYDSGRLKGGTDLPKGKVYVAYIEYCGYFREGPSYILSTGVGFSGVAVMVDGVAVGSYWVSQLQDNCVISIGKWKFVFRDRDYVSWPRRLVGVIACAVGVHNRKGCHCEYCSKVFAHVWDGLECNKCSAINGAELAKTLVGALQVVPMPEAANKSVGGIHMITDIKIVDSRKACEVVESVLPVRKRDRKEWQDVILSKPKEIDLGKENSADNFHSDITRQLLVRVNEGQYAIITDTARSYND